VSRGAQAGPGRWLGVAFLVVLAAIFSFLNAGERVTLNVGVTNFYRISLVGLVFASFLLGMISMFLFGLRHDRQVRSVLRERHQRPSPREYSYHPPPGPPE